MCDEDIHTVFIIEMEIMKMRKIFLQLIDGYRLFTRITNKNLLFPGCWFHELIKLKDRQKKINEHKRTEAKLNDVIQVK